MTHCNCRGLTDRLQFLGGIGGRREVMEDGTELRFDHGAPYFTVTNDEVAQVVGGWEARGIVAEWKAMFACFDRATGKFTDFEKVQFPNPSLALRFLRY